MTPTDLYSYNTVRKGKSIRSVVKSRRFTRNKGIKLNIISNPARELPFERLNTPMKLKIKVTAQ
jgi:hypothetical protein